MVKECDDCSMRLPEGYSVQDTYLCRGCYERLYAKEVRDKWLFKAEAKVVKMITRNKDRRK